MESLQDLLGCGRWGALVAGCALGLSGTGAAAQNSRQPAHRDARAVTGTGTVTVAVPIGKVRVGPEYVEGEPSYPRRITSGGGMTVVELSSTPTEPVAGITLANADGAVRGNPAALPAPW